MKKLFLVMLTVAMTTCFMACKTEGNKPATEGEKPATEKPAQEVKTVTLEEMTALVEKAKAEGKDWSVDQWKDACRTMMMGLKPMFDVMLDFQKKTEDPEAKKRFDKNPAEAAQLMTDMLKALEPFKPMEKVMDEFEEAQNASANGKLVAADTTWLNNMAKELGVPLDAIK